jgi:hypothetical protein
MRSRALRATLSVAVAALAAACGTGSTKPEPIARTKPAAKPTASAPEAPLPAYLQHFPGLYVRKGGEIVEAPEADVAVAKSYPRAAEKGPLIDGHRLTLLTAKRTYRVGEEVRVIHVHEVAIEGEQVYVMGPKPIRGELVNGKMVTPAVLADVDPFIPAIYDGAVLPSPAVDYNWEITSYRFSAPGGRTIQWKLGNFASNVLTIEVVP